MRQSIISPGQVYGRLTVIRRNGTTSHTLHWLCRCECGKETSVGSSNLHNGTTKSCGCYRREFAASLKFSHGKAHTPEYSVWESMIGRCHCPGKSGYCKYGARGIYVCQRWRDSFPDFLADMGPRPSIVHSIERNDNNGPYSPENCRWATSYEQRRNTRRTVLITINGVTKIVSDWAKELKMKPNTIKKRYLGK